MAPERMRDDLNAEEQQAALIPIAAFRPDRGISPRADVWQGDDVELRAELAALIEVTDPQHRAVVGEALRLVDYALETARGSRCCSPSTTKRT
jgi:hypothetical protein